ncbi:hypothetical protein [Brevibacillus borstelensis]|uniref:hypothetical protein n=1 Tax=Brevibacillus borstelensis TaxID=45462 RepID=UPI0030C10BB8
MKHVLLSLFFVAAAFASSCPTASGISRDSFSPHAAVSEPELHTSGAAPEEFPAPSPVQGREQLLEGALLNRYLELIGSTLQKPFGCGKIASIKRLGDPRLPAFEVAIEVVSFGAAYGQPPYDLVTLTVRDRPDLVTLIGIDKRQNISGEEYKERCGWLVR